MVNQAITNVTSKELEKLVNLQEEISNPFIMLIKPRAKEKVKIFDSDTAVFIVDEDKLIFNFWELDGFEFPISMIKEIVYEELDTDMLIVHICLKYGNSYMLHFTRI